MKGARLQTSASRSAVAQTTTTATIAACNGCVVPFVKPGKVPPTFISPAIGHGIVLLAPTSNARAPGIAVIAITERAV